MIHCYFSCKKRIELDNLVNDENVGNYMDRVTCIDCLNRVCSEGIYSNIPEAQKQLKTVLYNQEFNNIIK